MTALNGRLDGATAEALKGLYGFSEPEPETLAEDSDWEDFEDSSSSDGHCDNCGDGLDGPGFEQPHTQEILCGECDRRNNTHAVGRFSSIRSRDRDELD